MVNEVLQWAVLFAMAFLLLGLFRQVALMLPTHYRAQAISGPQIGQRMPRTLLRVIQEAEGNLDVKRDTLIAFVTESCVACQRLLAEVPSRFDSGSESTSLILVARQATPAFREAIEELGIPVVHDDGRLWAACRVTNTPLVVHIDSEGKVIAKGVTHDVDSVMVPAA